MPIEQAEAALSDARNRHEAILDDLAERRRALEREQQDARATQDADMRRLEAALKDARTSFSKQLEAWAQASVEN